MKSTIYDQRYKSKENYWDFRPSIMAMKVLELLPPFGRDLKLLEIGSGEGANSIFFALNGFRVTAFDLSKTGLEKTKQRAGKAGVHLEVFQADVNEFLPKENFDVVFSSGTLQYLLPEKREPFIRSLQAHTNPGGVNVLHTFVSKPFVSIAPDAEPNEHLWTSGELLYFYRNWLTENFIEEIRDCNSSGVAHRHVHNRIWSRNPQPSVEA